MGRRQRGQRVLGPYKERAGWRVVLVETDGTRTPRFFKSEAKAKKYREVLEAEITAADHDTESAAQEYKRYLSKKGNKKTSRDHTIWAINRFFPDPLPLWGLTEKRCQKLYDKLTEELPAADSHRNALAETKTFLKWCVKRGWLRKNPLEKIEGIGKRKHGKAQLRNREARIWEDTALELAGAGDSGAVAALLALIMGMRCTEIVTRVVRDVDDDHRHGGLLWIPDSKTEAGRRTLVVPEHIRPYLLALTTDKLPHVPLFPTKRSKSGFHDRDWIRAQVVRICKLAKVPEVTAHGMRGTNATLAEDDGMAPLAVARSLGHKDVRTTHRSYSQSREPERTKQRKALKVLKGGKK